MVAKISSLYLLLKSHLIDSIKSVSYVSIAFCAYAFFILSLDLAPCLLTRQGA
jgi:hypothetical protein